jgi:hypothetical protein
MSDLVGRLRTHVAEYYSGRPVNLALCKDAADEIERLRERLAKLQGTPPNVLFYQEQAKYWPRDRLTICSHSLLTQSSDAPTSAL